jgi:hypothetical protein
MAQHSRDTHHQAGQTIGRLSIFTIFHDEFISIIGYYFVCRKSSPTCFTLSSPPDAGSFLMRARISDFGVSATFYTNHDYILS